MKFIMQMNDDEIKINSKIQFTIVIYHRIRINDNINNKRVKYNNE